MRVHRLDPVQNARSNMVLSQLKPNGVVDWAILRVMDTVSRENFIPISALSLAYGDSLIFCDIPGRYIFAPQTLGLFLQNLDLAPQDKVLVVGGNYGYTATILFELGCQVCVVESHPILVAQCREKLKKHNGVIESGSLNFGLAEYGPYQAIIIEVGLKAVPHEIIEQLDTGGRVALCLADDGGNLSKACVFEKKIDILDLVIAFDGNMPLYHEPDAPINFRF
jgi:protein-L-isoaspartate(D-aspartate) O-methyltransferase